MKVGDMSVLGWALTPSVWKIPGSSVKNRWTNTEHQGELFLLTPLFNTFFLSKIYFFITLIFVVLQYSFKYCICLIFLKKLKHLFIYRTCFYPPPELYFLKKQIYSLTLVKYTYFPQMKTKICLPWNCSSLTYLHEADFILKNYESSWTKKWVELNSNSLIS